MMMCSAAVVTLLLPGCGGATSTAPSPPVVAAAQTAPTPAPAAPAPRPTTPMAGPLVLNLTGQSNAKLLRNWFNGFLGTVPNVTVTGWSDGGRTIDCWDSPTAATDGEDCWQLLLPSLHQPMDAVVFWHGESDADYHVAPGYYAGKLAALMTRIRAEAGKPSLLIAVMELGPHYTGSAPKAELEAWAKADPFAIYVPTNDLPFDNLGVHMLDDGGLPVIAQRIDQAVRARLGPR